MPYFHFWSDMDEGTSWGWNELIPWMLHIFIINWWRLANQLMAHNEYQISLEAVLSTIGSMLHIMLYVTYRTIAPNVMVARHIGGSTLTSRKGQMPESLLAVQPAVVNLIFHATFHGFTWWPHYLRDRNWFTTSRRMQSVKKKTKNNWNPLSSISWVEFPEYCPATPFTESAFAGLLRECNITYYQ